MTIPIQAQIKTGLLGLLLGGLVLGSCTASESNPTGALKVDQPATAELDHPTVRAPSRPVVSIASLRADQADQAVAIAGNVAQRVALLEGWLYQVQDETGRLWVVSSGAEPEVGQLAIVEGIVRYEAIVVDGIDAGELYLEEQAYAPSEG